VADERPKASRRVGLGGGVPLLMGVGSGAWRVGISPSQALCPLPRKVLVFHSCIDYKAFNALLK